MKYYVDLISPEGEKVTLGWTDKLNEGDLTPFPKVISNTPTPTLPTVEVNVVGDTSKVNITIQ